jgi:plastocyanin
MKIFHLYFIATLTILAIAGCAFQTPEVDDDHIHGVDDIQDEEHEENEEIQESTTETQIMITDSGFEPRTVTINAGDTLTFVNENSVARWPASNRHPTHTNYPADYAGGSYGSSRGCNGEGDTKDGAFDACKRLSAGEQFAFTFNEVGTWQYHDHNNPATGGTVIVE